MDLTINGATRRVGTEADTPLLRVTGQRIRSLPLSKFRFGRPA